MPDVVKEVSVNVPVVVLVPVQAPLAVHEVAPVLLHVRIDKPPTATDVALADNDTAGGAPLTVTAIVLDALPPAPEQDKIKLASAVIELITALPEVAFAPLQLPLAVQLVVSVLDQVSVVEPL